MLASYRSLFDVSLRRLRSLELEGLFVIGLALQSPVLLAAVWAKVGQLVLEVD